jgi:tetratricopeptide (TPR) repeat protein
VVVLTSAVCIALLFGLGGNASSAERDIKLLHDEAVQRAVQAVAEADALAASDNHKQAIQKYIEGIRTAGDHLPAPEVVIYNLGLSFKSIGHTEQAIRSFNQSLLLLADTQNSRAREVHIQLAESCSSIAMWPCAATHFTAASVLQPSNAVIHFNLGNVLLNQKLNETISRSVAHFKKAVELNPSRDDFQAHLAVALVHTNTKANVEEAKTLLESCLPNEDPELHLFVAFSIEELVPALTLTHLERCVEIDGGRTLAKHPQRTSIYYRLGR